MSLGSLLGGVAGDAFDAGTVMLAGGFGCLWIVGYVAAIPSLRELPAPAEIEGIDGLDPVTTDR